MKIASYNASNQKIWMVKGASYKIPPPHIKFVFFPLHFIPAIRQTNQNGPDPFDLLTRAIDRQLNEEDWFGIDKDNKLGRFSYKIPPQAVLIYTYL
jgi:hypothetical protein